MLNGIPTKAVLFGCLVIALAGCITTTTKNGRVVPNEPSEFSKQMRKVKNSAVDMVAAITPSQQPDPIFWDWSAGMPQSVLKSEALPVSIPEAAVAHFAPQVNRHGNQLVNYTPQAAVSISSVNQTRIRTLADLDTAIDQVLASSNKKGPVVEFTGGFTGNSAVPAELSTNNLVALEQTCLPDRSPVRVVDEGNPWVLIRDDAIRCKIMLRRERTSNLVHVVTSLKVCWGAPKKLPISLQCTCEGKPLACLSVSQTLESLYGREKGKEPAPHPMAVFAEVAERDEFVTPVNYRVLEAKLAKDQRLASIRPYPAFAVVGGYAYPGPPVLGDARALSGFMLQPRVYSADEAERPGWVVFDGSNCAGKESFDVQIDLGSGPQPVAFRIPIVTQ